MKMRWNSWQRFGAWARSQEAAKEGNSEHSEHSEHSEGIPKRRRTNWHSAPLEAVLGAFLAEGQGLTQAEAARKLREVGPNLLRHESRWTPLRLVLGQFCSPLTGVLLFAAVFAFALRDLADGWVILAIVLLNATFGFLLDYRASNAVRGLVALHPPRANLLRDGKRQAVVVSEVVPGDVLLLEAGNAVPADARLLECFGFQCAEAVLTGEAAPVEKDASSVLPPETPLAERVTMAFAGTTVAAGRARALVVATGMDTEVGRIAHLLASTPGKPSPGLREVGELSRVLLWGAGLLVPMVLAAGWLRGQADLSEALWMGVSLAVAALPEGMQTVLMAALAVGAHRLATRNAVIRRLGALETLGCVDVVCTDKTGTLTEGRMSVVTILTAGGDLAAILARVEADVPPPAILPGSEGYCAIPPRHFFDELSDADRKRVSETLAGACTGDTLSHEEHERWSTDPTEVALLAAARKILPESEQTHPLVLGWIQREIPFDSVRRRHTRLRRTAAGKACVYVTGAPEEVLALCKLEWVVGGVRAIDAERRQWWVEQNARLAGASLRMLASAYRTFEGDGGVEGEDLEKNLILVGLVGLRDAVRPDASPALQRASALGVKVVMLTGDQPQTAAAIARELGFEGAGSEVISGAQLDGWDDAELARRVDAVRLFARVAPEHKLRVVEAWKSTGAVVAMIGDGVNDAPALQAADVGVAMGGGGTHVTREAGDLVLLDDRLGTLMEALAQGRRVRTSVGRAMEYLLTGNAGEVILIGGGLLAAGVSVLSPLQLLWINLVTDGLPALLLALPVAGSSAEAGAREPSLVSLTSPRLWTRVIVFGSCAAVCAGLAYDRGCQVGGVPVGKSYAFGAVVFEELLRSVVIGLEPSPGAGGSRRAVLGLMATMIAGSLVQVALLRVESAAHLLGAAPLTGAQIVEAFFLGATAVCAGRFALLLRRRSGPVPPLENHKIGGLRPEIQPTKTTAATAARTSRLRPTGRTR
jgi:Ca2+-transporting ATPase